MPRRDTPISVPTPPADPRKMGQQAQRFAEAPPPDYPEYKKSLRMSARAIKASVERRRKKK